MSVHNLLLTLPLAMADPTTQSNYLEIASEQVHFDWKLDFDAKIISGSATHDLRVKADDVKEVM
jgi:leukotriene-A4 hydrolase